MRVQPPYRHAAVATVLTVLAFVVLLSFFPRLALSVVQEDGAVEWLQVALFIAAAVTALVIGRRPPTVLNVLLALLFGMFVELEVDLDRRMFGRPVIDKRFLLDANIALLPRLLTVLVLGGLAIAVVVYVWHRRAELVGAIAAMLRTPGGHIVLAGLGVIAIVQVFEKSLNFALPLPRYLLEESLELIAALYCFLGVLAHVRHGRR